MNKAMLIFTVGVFGVILGSFGVFAGKFFFSFSLCERGYMTWAMVWNKVSEKLKLVQMWFWSFTPVALPQNRVVLCSCCYVGEWKKRKLYWNIHSMWSMKYELIVAINLCSCTDGPPATCCLELRSSRVSLEKVLNYRIQTKGLCPIKAVV